MIQYVRNYKRRKRYGENEMTPIYLLSGIFMDFLEIESTRCAKSMA